MAKTISHLKYLFKQKGTDYAAYFEYLQAYFPECEIDNIIRDPNQLSFLVNNIPTTVFADQITTQIKRHDSTIHLTEKPRWLLIEEKLNEINLEIGGPQLVFSMIINI